MSELELQVLDTAEAEAWRAAMPAGRNVFASHGFARVQERAGGGEARLLVLAREGRPLAAWPLLLRQLPILGSDPIAGVDATTPPFTGPIAVPGAGPLPAGAHELVEARLRELGAVTCFGHLNPWHVVSEALDADAVSHDRELVYVDCARSDEELERKSFSHAARKNLRRSEREGVLVRAADGDEDIAEFHRIFAMTMVRREALGSYRLGLDYFLALRDELGDGARFMLAEHDGRVAAATVYLCDDTDVYSYLGGQDNDHQSVRPTNAVIAATIRWARETGRRRLVLGSGYRPGDGIMRFKSSFSPLRADLSLQRQVLDRDTYERLVEAWRRSAAPDAEAGKFFPAYRAPLAVAPEQPDE